MKITINIPNGKEEKVLTGFEYVYDYQNKKLPEETREAFTKRKVIEHIKNVTKEGNKLKFESENVYTAPNLEGID